MLELLLCSMLTIVPDFLIRRFAQGKRIGREITLYSVWFELRWGITACLVLTVSLITTVFFFHPASTSVTSLFRTVPVLPEASGRVAEIYVGMREEVTAGTPLFRLDSSQQEAAVETARRRVAEVEAAIILAETERDVAKGGITEARGAWQQAVDELETRVELRSRNTDTVALREIEKLQNVVDARQGSVDKANANLRNIETKIAVQLPAQRDSATAALAEAEIALSKTTVYAAIDGRLEQFTLRPGDIVNPFMRPAGILIPSTAGRVGLQAGFGQVESQVIHAGMIGEVTCPAIAFTIIPVVVTEVQSVIATGQIRASDTLVDVSQVNPTGTMTVFMEPLFEGQLDRLLPGSNCIANLYTSNHDRLADPELGSLTRLALHGVDTVGMVHAMLIRLQALLIPVRTLVLGGGH